MGEPGREEHKTQSFDAETQQLLKTALQDPGAVDLEKLANVIVGSGKSEVCRAGRLEMETPAGLLYCSLEAEFLLLSLVFWGKP